MPTVLITGANRGLGLEFARQYAADAWHVIAACRTPEESHDLQEIARQRANLQIASLDVSDPASIKALASQHADHALDLLINNAGIFSGNQNIVYAPDRCDRSQSLGSIDATAWMQVFQINSIAPVLVAEAFLPQLKRSTTPKLIAMTSKMGSIGTMSAVGDIAYRSSKAALNAAFCNLALSLQADKVAVAVLHPGWVQTDMGGQTAPLTPPESVTGMRKVITNLTMSQSGSFLNYDGSSIAW